MRWWLRVVATLILAPLLWRFGSAYVANQQGASWSDLAQQSIPLLASVYLTFTLPALVLCGLLAFCDLVLHKLGLDLLTVLVSPAIALAVASGAVHVAREQHVQAATGGLVLAVVYGFVWSLTIREPRGRSEIRRTTTGADTATSSTAMPTA